MAKHFRSDQLLGTAGALLLCLGCIFSLFPILWMALTAFKLPNDYFAVPFRWVPQALTLQHWGRLVFDLDGARSLINSMIISFGSMLLTLSVSIPAAYAIAKAKHGILRLAPIYVLALRALPPVILLIPLYLIYSRFGLLDSFIGLILAFTTFNIPFTIWMLLGFFEDFPSEVQEAALLDGLSEFGSLVRIVLPMISPAIVVVAFFAFLAAWNELMLSVTFTGQNTQTVTKLISSLLQSPTGADFGAAAAISTLSMLPGILLVAFGQRFLVKGLTGGSVK